MDTAIRTNLRTSYLAGPNKLVSGPMYTSTGSAAGYGLGYKDNTSAKTVTVQVALYGDADLNGTVGFSDLTAVLNNYNHAATWQTGDFNYDGSCGFADLTSVLNNYNHPLPAGFGDGGDSGPVGALAGVGSGVPVPEPGTLAMLASVLLGVFAYAWRRRK